MRALEKVVGHKFLSYPFMNNDGQLLDQALDHNYCRDIVCQCGYMHRVLPMDTNRLIQRPAQKLIQLSSYLYTKHKSIQFAYTAYRSVSQYIQALLTRFIRHHPGRLEVHTKYIIS
jgi:hypothetical protein